MDEYRYVQIGEGDASLEQAARKTIQSYLIDYDIDDRVFAEDIGLDPDAFWEEVYETATLRWATVVRVLDAFEVPWQALHLVRGDSDLVPTVLKPHAIRRWARPGSPAALKLLFVESPDE